MQSKRELAARQLGSTPLR